MGVGRVKCGFGAKKGVADQGKTCGSQNRIFVDPVFQNSEKRSRNLMVLGCVFSRRVSEMSFQNSENQSNIDGFAVARQKLDKKVLEMVSRTLVFCVFRDRGPFGMVPWRPLRSEYTFSGW